MNIDRKRRTYIWKSDRPTASPSPPARELFFSCYSPRRRTLIGYPIDCGEAIWRIVIPASSSNTGNELTDVNAFNPRYSGLVYECGIRVIKVVNSKLYVYFLVRVKYVRFKLDDVTLIFLPGRYVLKRVSTSLKWKTCQRTKAIRRRPSLVFTNPSVL